MVDFERLSLGGYGDLRYIKSIWIDSPGPGDQIPRSVGSKSLYTCALLVQLPREKEVHRHGKDEVEVLRQRLRGVARVNGAPASPSKQHSAKDAVL